MDISTLFKQTIADIFYDKIVNIYSTKDETGEELDTIRTKGDLKEDNLSCNVHQIGNELAKKDYGLDIDANIMVTCDKTMAELGDILTYLNQDYCITGKLILDSHTKLFAKLGGLSG